MALFSRLYGNLKFVIKIVFLGGSPFFLKSIFEGSPRISFAFSLTDSLIGSYLFQKGRVFHRSFGFSIFKMFIKNNGAFQSSIYLKSK
jgi:hypothetical protein